jgi:hypothetical protein
MPSFDRGLVADPDAHDIWFRLNEIGALWIRWAIWVLSVHCDIQIDAQFERAVTIGKIRLEGCSAS